MDTNHKISNLEELHREKVRLQAQLKIVQTELSSSAMKTRQEFKTLVDEKLSLSKQLGQMLQGGAKQSPETNIIGALGRVAGQGTWWGGVAATLLPVVVDFIRKQIENRKERQIENRKKRELEPKTEGAEPKTEGAEPKTKMRRLFKRKPKKES